MYIPKAFLMDDKEVIQAFIRQNSFGILFSQHDDLFATHLPFILEGEYLYSHFAKANPQWKNLQNQDVLLVFHGPHAYISPGWYREEKAVPTWNYTAVHISGRVEIIDDKVRIQQLFTQMIESYESYEQTNWSANMDSEYIDNMLQGIVFFSVHIKAIEAKWKLSQNHSLLRQQNVVNGLQCSKQRFAQDISKLMEQNINRSNSLEADNG